MAGEDAAHVGALDHRRQAVLVVQLDELGRAQHRQRERRVVHGEQGAVRRGRREHVGQPRQLGVGQVAVVVAGDAGVQRDDPQAVDLVHPVLGAVVVGAEQARAYGARSSWLPIVQTTVAPIAAAAGSTSSRSRA